MKIKDFKPIPWILALLICLLFPATGKGDEYQVKLKNGKIMKTRMCYEKDGTVFLYKYGNYIGIDKSEVEEITQTKDPTVSADPGSSKKAGSSKGTTSSQKSKSAKTKNSGTSSSRGTRKR